MILIFCLYTHCITDHSKKINYKDILNDLSLPEVKKAGTILDGCKVKFKLTMFFKILYLVFKLIHCRFTLADLV